MALRGEHVVLEPLAPEHAERLRELRATPAVDIFLGPDHHDRGLGTDAMRTIVRHLIDDRGHHRITLSGSPDNARAIHVYEKVGFRPVGITRKSQRNPITGEWEDELLMELVV